MAAYANMPGAVGLVPDTGKDEKAKATLDVNTMAYKLPALPPVRRARRPAQKLLPGVSYLSTSGIYDEMMAAKNPYGTGHMTRRNITEHKISQNILNHNSPVVMQNFNGLHLGPKDPFTFHGNARASHGYQSEQGTGRHSGGASNKRFKFNRLNNSDFGSGQRRWIRQQSAAARFDSKSNSVHDEASSYQQRSSFVRSSKFRPLDPHQREAFSPTKVIPQMVLVGTSGGRNQINALTYGSGSSGAAFGVNPFNNLMMMQNQSGLKFGEETMMRAAGSGTDLQVPPQ